MPEGNPDSTAGAVLSRGEHSEERVPSARVCLPLPGPLQLHFPLASPWCDVQFAGFKVGLSAPQKASSPHSAPDSDDFVNFRPEFLHSWASQFYTLCAPPSTSTAPACMSSHEGQVWPFATVNSAQSAASRLLLVMLDILREKSFILVTVAKAKGCF